MKKLLLFFFAIASSANCFSQEWSEWKSFDCHPALYYSFANYGYSKDAGGYLWGVRFKNGYTSSLSFAYKINIGEKVDVKNKNTFLVTPEIEPGGIFTDGGSMFTAHLFQNPSSNAEIAGDDVCFNRAQCAYYRCFARCDQGSPRQSDCSGKTTQQPDNGYVPVDNKKPSREKLLATFSKSNGTAIADKILDLFRTMGYTFVNKGAHANLYTIVFKEFDIRIQYDYGPGNILTNPQVSICFDAQTYVNRYDLLVQLAPINGSIIENGKCMQIKN